MSGRRDGRRKKRYMDDDAQSTQDRAKLRRDFVDLRDFTMKNKNKLIDINANEYYNTLKKQEKLSEDVLFPSEAVLDYSQLHLMGEIGALRAQKSRENILEYSCNDIVVKLRQKFSNHDGKINWNDVGFFSSTFLPSVPRFSSMLGTFHKEQSERKVRGHREKTKFSDKAQKKAANLENASREEKSQTDERIRHSLMVLENLNGQADFIEFICNPVSFSETVENLFDVSFLVRHNKVGIIDREINNEKTLMLERRAEPTEEDYMDAQPDQSILYLDIPTYLRFKQIIERKNAENFPLVGRRS